MLWNELTHVVILTEQMRVTDKLYKEMLDRISEGKTTEEDYEVLQSRIICNGKIDLNSSTFKQAPMIVPGNRIRSILNELHVQTHANDEQEQMIQWSASDSCQKLKITASKTKQLADLPYTRTGGLPGKCALMKHMPVMLTRNVAVELGLTNGIIGKVVKILAETAGKEFSEKQKTIEQLPLCVIVKFEKLKCPKLKYLDEKEIPVYPMKTTFKHKFPGTKTSYTITREQLPLEPAYAYTAHKAQGKTLPSVIVDLTPTGRKPSNNSFAYVPLSRVQKLEHLAILRPFPLNILQIQKSADHKAQDELFANMNNISSH